MTVADLKALQLPALVLLAAILAGTAAVYYTDGLLQQARRELALQEQQLKEARTRLYRSGEEREIITRHLDGYRALQRIGFIGEEKRINWLDGLRLANQRAELFGVDYQISAQQPYIYSAEFNPGQISLHQSVMKLRFRLLHEEDLMRFFRILAQTGAGIFSIDECTLKRIEKSGAIRFQPNLGAECELTWLTAQPAGAEKKP